jgi:hypothetical protein
LADYLALRVGRPCGAVTVWTTAWGDTRPRNGPAIMVGDMVRPDGRNDPIRRSYRSRNWSGITRESLADGMGQVLLR